MMFEGVLLLGALIFGAVWFTRGGSFDRLAGGRSETSLEILERRLADGVISVDEYHERRAVLMGDAFAREAPIARRDVRGH